MTNSIQTVARVLLIAFSAVALPVVADEREGFRLELPLGLIEPDIPPTNRLTAERIDLGRKLFFDARLSRNGDVSCASCHDPKVAFADSRRLSAMGTGEVQRRNSPTLLNVGFLTSIMWDGRSRSLEEQVIGAFQPYDDMGIHIGDALARIASDTTYQDLFSRAYGSAPTAESTAKAIASFERSLLAGNSRFDRFLYGGDIAALTSQERIGFNIFASTGSCINCHDVFHPAVNPLGGALATFTDNRFHNLGVGYINGRMHDTGRFEVTRTEEDWGAFRTPSLRNVAVTGPYMHDGSLATLREVVEFYNKGGVLNPRLSPGIRPLLLSEAEIDAMVAFLRALTSPEYE